MSKRVSRFWLIGPWVLFVLIAAAWLFYWHAVERQAKATLAQWFAEQAAQGNETACAPPKTHGFPVMMRLELHDCAYAPAGGDWRAETARIDLNVNMTNPAHAIFEAQAPIRFETSEGMIHELSAETMLLSLRMQGEAIAQVGLEADNLALDNPARDGILRARKVVLNLRPDPRDRADYQLALETVMLELARPVRSFEPFGHEIAQLRGAVVLEHSEILIGAPDADPFKSWRDNRGRARLEGLQINWGPLAAEGQGALALDAENRIEGRLDLDISNPGPALTALAESGDLSDDAKQALQLVGAGFSMFGGGASFDVEAQNGQLAIEGAPIRSLDPVY